MPAPAAEPPAELPGDTSRPLSPQEQQPSEQEQQLLEQKQPPPQQEQQEQQVVAAQPQPPPQQAVPQLQQPPQRPSLKSLLSDALAAQAVTALTSKPAAQETSQLSPQSPPPPQQPQQVEQRRTPKPPAEVQLHAAQQEGPAAAPVPGEPASKAPQRPQQPAVPPTRLPPYRGRGGGGGRAQGMPAGWKQRALQYAQQCLESGRSEEVRVWQVNSAGVLVENDYLSGAPRTQHVGMLPAPRCACWGLVSEA